jgi:hypothetical protein
MIEGDLIHKLQVRESELANIKGHTLPSLQSELALKTQTLEKAEHIVKMVNSELDSNVSIVKRLESDLNHVKIENKQLMVRL